MKKTKIIATLGPATNTEDKLIALYDAGINIIRFNFSHADYEGAQKTADLIKKLNSLGRTNLSLLLDTKGPEIRTGDVENKIQYSIGDIFKIYVDKNKLSGDNSLFCDYSFLIEDVEIGQNIVIDSGLLNTKVVSKSKDYVEVEAENGALIGSRRHINLPGVRLKLPGITEKDEIDINFGILNDFDFIAASFVRNKEGIDDIRKLFEVKNNSHIKIISKIENAEAIENLDDIIKYSDGVMVARGDLGVEVPVEKLSVYQREIVDKCKNLGKFVIIATHLLETMIDNPFPTRAETSDVFNSILQQPDCLMLSGETAIGKYPIEAVKMMVKVIKEAEKFAPFIHKDYSNEGLRTTDIEKKMLIRSGIFIGEDLGAKALIILTKTGILARLASFFRPKINVYAFTKYESTVRYINSLFGINPFYLEKRNSNNFLDTMELAINYLIEKGVLTKGDRVIAINDIKRNGEDTSVMEIINV
ncbi:MAG: pyruvate kinase [Candidatus Gracilibacteria bacterium]